MNNLKRNVIKHLRDRLVAAVDRVGLSAIEVGGVPKGEVEELERSIAHYKNATVAGTVSLEILLDIDESRDREGRPAS